MFVFLTVSSYSQGSFTKDLQWTPLDSIAETILQDTNQIIEWGMNTDIPQASYRSKSIHLNDCKIFILMVDICSGIYCPIISVFKKETNHWCLITRTHAHLTEQIEIEVDNKLQKVIFKTKSSKIGELPIEQLLE